MVSEVTPFVGVWIETITALSDASKGPSHPSWVCGLKQQADACGRTSDSHTLRGCVD